MACLTHNRNSPFSPFSVDSVTEIHRPPYKGGCFRCRFSVGKQRPEKDPLDTRVTCTNRRHLAQRNRCQTWKAAGLKAPDVAAAIKAMRQHCPGFAPVVPRFSPGPTQHPDRTRPKPDRVRPNRRNPSNPT